MPTTPEQQLALELINRSRANPAGEYDALIVDAASQTAVQANITNALRFFNVDLGLFQTQLAGYPSVAPVAWNDNLAQSAATHNDYMIAEDEQSHNLPGEPNLETRFNLAGYTGWTRIAENIYAYSQDVLHAHAGFYIDWGGSAATGGIQDPAGHRNAILRAEFTEVGISWDDVSALGLNIGPYVTTQHFGNRFAYDPQLLGVVIDDLDGDDFYDIGEGMAGVTVTATGAAGTFVTTTWDSGGYQMVLPDGVYTVTFSGGALNGMVTMTVTMDGANVKADAIADEATTGGGDGPGDDIIGTTDPEELTGTAASEYIFGDLGDDTLLGGEGDDVLEGGEGADLIDGGAGQDTVSYENSTRSVRVDLQNDAFMFNDAVGDTFADVEVFRTGNTIDQLRGDAGDNIFYTGGLSDRLYGRAGDDMLFGEAGADAFYGGRGADTMTGGDDADRRDRYIYFNEAESGVGEGNRDVITDFVSGEDRIEVSRFDADPFTAGNQAFTFIGAAGFSGTAGELGYRQEGGNTIVQMDIDGDAAADFEIELTGTMTLVEGDFLL